MSRSVRPVWHCYVCQAVPDMSRSVPRVRHCPLCLRMWCVFQGYGLDARVVRVGADSQHGRVVLVPHALEGVGMAGEAYVSGPDRGLTSYGLQWSATAVGPGLTPPSCHPNTVGEYGWQPPTPCFRSLETKPTVFCGRARFWASPQNTLVFYVPLFYS